MSADHSLTIAEAAAHFGVAAATIRRRIKTGELAAFKHTTPYGFEWRINISQESQALITSPIHEAITPEHSPDQTIESPDHKGDQSSAPEVIRALDLVSDLTRRNEQLAGQVGFLQAKVQEQERQIALLMAPKDELAKETPAAPERVSWWKRMWGG